MNGHVLKERFAFESRIVYRRETFIRTSILSLADGSKLSITSLKLLVVRSLLLYSILRRVVYKELMIVYYCTMRYRVLTFRTTENPGKATQGVEKRTVFKITIIIISNYYY